MSDDYSKKELRRFALVFTLVLGIFSVRFCKSSNVFLGGLFLASAFVTFAIGLFQPTLIMPLYKLLKSLILILRGILLGIIFYCVFTPIGILLRVTRRDILGLRLDKNKDSYWIKRKDRFIKPESLERQF